MAPNGSGSLETRIGRLEQGAIEARIPGSPRIGNESPEPSTEHRVTGPRFVTEVVRLTLHEDPTSRHPSIRHNPCFRKSHAYDHPMIPALARADGTHVEVDTRQPNFRKPRNHRTANGFTHTGCCFDQDIARTVVGATPLIEHLLVRQTNQHSVRENPGASMKRKFRLYRLLADRYGKNHHGPGTQFGSIQFDFGSIQFHSGSIQGA